MVSDKSICRECGKSLDVNPDGYCESCMQTMFDLVTFRRALIAGASLTELQAIANKENGLNARSEENDIERKNIITAFQLGVL